MDFIIRKAELKDANIVNNFLTKLIKDEKKYDTNINDNFVVHTFYENFIEDEQNCCLIAEYNGKIIGYLYGFVQNNGNTYINIITQLDAMFVDNEYRKLGIGNALIGEFKNWSKEKNAKYIELKVCNNNDNAISLYKKNGFKNAKTIMSVEVSD
ncbi:MAG: GNAT family N-acetyltransferase [Firmicutes bacterium]|nr:GNAT family N-acetyltransferase [Bacillota bacterium]